MTKLFWETYFLDLWVTLRLTWTLVFFGVDHLTYGLPLSLLRTTLKNSHIAMAADEGRGPNPPGPPQAPPPMKVLPQTYKITPFSGEDPSYNPLDFIHQCEDALTSVLVVEPKDKINFVKQQLQGNSKAFQMMRTLDFKAAYEEGDYAKFRSLFLSTFGEAKLENAIRVLSQTVDDILKGQNAHAVYDAQIPAAKLTEAALRVLKTDVWSNEDCVFQKPHLLFLSLILSHIPQLWVTLSVIVTPLQARGLSPQFLRQAEHQYSRTTR